MPVLPDDPAPCVLQHTSPPTVPHVACMQSHVLGRANCITWHVKLRPIGKLASFARAGHCTSSTRSPHTCCWWRSSWRSSSTGSAGPDREPHLSENGGGARLGTSFWVERGACGCWRWKGQGRGRLRHCRHRRVVLVVGAVLLRDVKPLQRVRRRRAGQDRTGHAVGCVG